MRTERQLERDLPRIIGDLALAPYPDYIDDVLATTAQRRQRPRWTFPERWFPTVEIARQPVCAPRLPWRSIVSALMLVALLLAAGAVFIGTRPPLPAPFGPARNGAIAYEAGGDIYAADLVAGTTTAIVVGPETDIGPRFSHDGTHIVFERKVDGEDSGGSLFVARSDGSGLTLITPESVQLTPSRFGESWPKYAFAPDGRSVLIAATIDGEPTIALAATDGSGVRTLDVPMAYEPSFRPGGSEILFVAYTPHNPVLSLSGIYAVDPSGGAVRTILKATFPFQVSDATWSPDGSQISYVTWQPDEAMTARTHIVSADGSKDRVLPAPPTAVWDYGWEWSNDGTRLIILRGYSDAYGDVRPVVIPADGSALGVELPYPGTINGECCAAFEWAPDDTRILVTPSDPLGRPMRQIILNPETGGFRPAPWTSTSDPTWQRLAP